MRPFGYKADLDTPTSYLFTIIIMPHDYWGEAKIKFPLPSYPKEDGFEDSAKYEVAVDGFGLDRQQVLAECSTWVDRKTITDLVCESEAARARVADDKKRCEAEEKKECRETGERPRKRGQADTVGSTLAESLTLGVKKALHVCTYCTKRGELFFFTLIYLFCFLSSLCRAPM